MFSDVENVFVDVFVGAPAGHDPRRAPGGPRGGPRALAEPDLRRAPLKPRAPQGSTTA